MGDVQHLLGAVATIGEANTGEDGVEVLWFRLPPLRGLQQQQARRPHAMAIGHDLKWLSSAAVGMSARDPATAVVDGLLDLG